MIISEKQHTPSIRNEKWIIAGGISILLLAALWLLVQSNKKQPIVIPDGSIYCDAETVSGDQFTKDGFSFSKGDLQNDEKSRSGSYSCKIEKGDGIQYGFGYKLQNFQPGEAFKVSVWRLKTPTQEGRLVIQGIKGQEFYKMVELPVQTDDNGWEKLETTFIIPFGEQAEAYNIYVYASGLNPAWFDDLTIEKKGRWQEDAMQPPLLDIKIEPNDLAKLKKKRDKALAKGLLKASDKDWVKAILIDAEGAEIPAQLRLKGDWTDHLQGDKWSFRIKVKSPYSWKFSNSEKHGLITFSVHTPATRYFLSEWLVHQSWLAEDILTPRYDFTEVRLNGKSLGIYAIEEHFEKQLVESKSRREGPILKFSEEGMWSGIERQLENHGYLHFDYRSTVMDWENAETEAFTQKQIEKSPVLSKQYEVARQLMFDFKTGQRSAADVFDLEKLAKFYAIADVFNAYHGIVWHNQRFYFNPVLGKLEPIGFDAFGGKPPRRYTILGEGALNPDNTEANRLFGYLLQDKDFCALYFNNLYHYSSKDYLTGFLENKEAFWDSKLKLLQVEFPEYQPDYKDFLEDGLFVHSLLLPFDNHSLKAFTQKTANGKKVLSVHNTHHLPVEVIGFGYSKQQMDGTFSEPQLLPAHVRRKYLSRILRDSIITDFKSTKFLHAQALAWQINGESRELEVALNSRFLFFKLPGIDSLFTSQISSRPRQELLVKNGLNEEFVNLEKNELLNIQGGKIIIKKGHHEITEPLIFPKGYEIFISEGTVLDFRGGSYLSSYSPIQITGSAENPITITSSDKTGKGIAVFQSQLPSSFQHVIFDNLGTRTSGRQMLTGAVTIYESKVNIYKCTFQNNRCEDALNTIRSEFKVDNCHFYNISSDAFDSDFCKGTINNSSFKDIFNDAMDFSGSVVTIENCSTLNTGDKGISVGEESDVSVLSTTIDSAPIAVASKDFSVLFVRDLTMRNCRQGFVAFQKKPEYGPGFIVVESYTAEAVDKLQNIAAGSSLQIKGQ